MSAYNEFIHTSSNGIYVYSANKCASPIPTAVATAFRRKKNSYCFEQQQIIHFQCLLSPFLHLFTYIRPSHSLSRIFSSSSFFYLLWNVIYECIYSIHCQFNFMWMEERKKEEFFSFLVYFTFISFFENWNKFQFRLYHRLSISYICAIRLTTFIKKKIHASRIDSTIFIVTHNKYARSHSSWRSVHAKDNMQN